IHAGNPDSHAVARSEAATGALSYEGMLLLDEQVVVVLERADMDQAIDEEIIQQHEESERCHAGNRTGELGTEMPLHELHLLQVAAVPLRRYRDTLPFARRTRDIGEPLLIEPGRSPIDEERSGEAMHD